jgi:hypothetical protein
MAEVFAHPEHVAVWHGAARGEMPYWRDFLAGYAAVVDWPAASFWPEIAAAFPDAPVLLSTRNPESWWESANATILPSSARAVGPWREMVEAMMAARFTSALFDRAAAIAAFEQHNAAVRAAVPAERLVEWRAGDGWEPICRALGVPVPDDPFPHVNAREQFLGALPAQ